MLARGKLVACVTLLSLLYAPFPATAALGALEVTRTTVEGQRAPLGIDRPAPRLSWQLASPQRNQRQTAYRVVVASSHAKLAAADVWDTGRVASDRSTQIHYAGPALRSRTRYHWSVQVWDAAGRASAWSAPAWFETGLTDWAAKWIAHNGTIPLPTTNGQQNYPAELTTNHTLGQTFQTDRSFDSVGGGAPTWHTRDSDFTMSLYHAGGDLIASRRIENHPDNAYAELTFAEPLPPGTYYLEQSDIAGKAGWWSHSDDVCPHGEAYADGVAVPGDRTIRWHPAPGAQATDHYTAKGARHEVFEPSFTFHGFRYVEVTGGSGRPSTKDVIGRVVGTNAPVTGAFESSSELLNRLQRNIMWSQRGNFLSIPTDCPQRDERMGWTGDINVFAPTASYNMDTSRFLGDKWLLDLRDAQRGDGAFPDVAPFVPIVGGGTAGWGDAGVTVPYTIWQTYGDTRVIEENYAAMTRWIDYLRANSTGLLRPDAGYGDWLNVDDPTPGDLIGTAYFAHVTRLLSEMAAATGRDADAARYRQLFADIKAAFLAEYVAVDGRVDGDSQTGYVLALSFRLLPDELRDEAAGHLVRRIESRGWHLSTGFLGTPDLLSALSDTGHPDVAYRLLNQRTYPSWGYEIERGATTIWERWDSIKPDGGLQDPAMNSFNHYAYGAVGEWLYGNVAGINGDPARPGYRHIVIRPRPGGELTHASGTYESTYGTISSAWRVAGNRFTLTVSIPVNTTATIHVPARNAGAVTESGRPAARAAGVTFLRMADGNAVFSVGSGTYRFAAGSLR